MKSIVKYSYSNQFIPGSYPAFAGKYEENRSFGLTVYPLNSESEAAAGICFQDQEIKSLSELFIYN
jgi:hypothetical protein